MMKRIVALIVMCMVILGGIVLGDYSKVEVVAKESTANYKCYVFGQAGIKIGKATYKAKMDEEGTIRIIQKKKGKIKKLIKNITCGTFLTNGQYIYYVSGKQNYYSGNEKNKIYKYDIKSGKKKRILTVDKQYEIELIARKGRYIYYGKRQEATLILYLYDLKKHKKKRIRFGDYSEIVVKGNRIYIYPIRIDDSVYYVDIYSLDGRKIGKIRDNR